MSKRERGIVSIMVTMVMMVVISLTVLGFAQVSRREQRESLDRKLSAQAFFAAETGINDAREAIRQSLASTGSVPSKNTCPTSPTGADYQFDPVIDAANNVSYTCLIVDPEVEDLLADIPSDGRSVTLAVEPATGNIDELQFRWSAKTSPTAAQLANCPAAVPASGAFKSVTSGAWTCPYGVLRVDIVQTNILSRAALEAGQRTVFFYPVNQGNASNQAYATADGRIVPIHCTVALCSANITTLPANGKFMLRVSALYAGGDLRLIAADPAGNPLGIVNSQVMIDATGRAQDVLRRVQVRVPLTNGLGEVPGFALESASSICKRFESTGTVVMNAADIQGQDQNNPLCVS